jgi:predicted ATPase
MRAWGFGRVKDAPYGAPPCGERSALVLETSEAAGNLAAMGIKARITPAHFGTGDTCMPFVVISGCSGGGKSTLLAELQDRGHAVVEEPGRRIVKEELQCGGQALPWRDSAAFARRAIAMSLADLEAAQAQSGWVFFDRGLVDAACALEQATGEPASTVHGGRLRYHPMVFLAPPWPEIFTADPERRHGFDEALAEYERLERAYPALGYDVVILPKAGVAERADFVLARLAS